MSWRRRFLGALAVCVLLPAGTVACGTGEAQERRNGESAAPVGRLLDDTDDEGRHYREMDDQDAPEVGIEVRPDAGGGWDVRLTVTDFRFSPAGTARKAVAGRGFALLLVDDRAVATLRGPRHRLAAGYLSHGTHHVTARLYADDDTVWAVDGRPVECTADVTASAPEAERSDTGGSTGAASSVTTRRAKRRPPDGERAERALLRTLGRCSPDRGGRAS